MKKCLEFVIMIFFFSQIGLRIAAGQSFLESPIMEAFNNGDYQKVVTAIPKWISDNNVAPERQGVPLYFLGESYYNLAMSSNSLNQARRYFERALSSFTQCLNKDDIMISHRNLFYVAQYKKGWSLFRLAELGTDGVINQLNKAFNSFNGIDSSAPDSLKILCAYMAGETRIRQETLKRYSIFMGIPTTLHINELLVYLNTAKGKFNDIVHSAVAPNDLKLAARIRLVDINFEKGKIYQGTPIKIFQKIRDGSKNNNPKNTAIAYFAASNYNSLLENLDKNTYDKIAPVINYSNAIRYLNLYFLKRDDNTRVALSNKLNSLAADFNVEKLFRKGNRDQMSSELSKGPFFKLSQSGSYYYRSAQSIPEAYYWLGFVQFVLNQQEAVHNFDLFLQNVTNRPRNLRLQFLIEDAQWRKYSLDFESCLNINGAHRRSQSLTQLENRVNQFNPNTPKISGEKTDLIMRIQIAKQIARGGSPIDIAGNIYADVLKRSINSALDQIRFLLPHAAYVTGMARARYIEALDILFRITQNRFSNETEFYKGITKSLNAEIQPTPSLKQQMFRQAASVLRDVGGNYGLEAKYIRARALFFAGNYKDAQAVFIDLINNQQSLRSLFYLGEIFRARGNGVAAKQCFEKIVHLTSGKEGGEFWLNNANSAIALCNNNGTVNPLKTIEINNVRFPDILLNIDGRPLTYEGLADYKYLQSEKAREGTHLLALFGLPKRSLYPSMNRLNNSQFISEGSFLIFNVPINEIQGAVNSSLKLYVFLSENLTGQVPLVQLDDKKIQAYKDSSYEEKNIPLNSTRILKIQAQRCFPFIRELKFKTPGVNTFYAVLNRKIKYEIKKGTHQSPVFSYFFPKRLDQNIVLQSISHNLNFKSDLYRDFSQNLYLRDVVYHPQLQKYLVVDAKNNKIIEYTEFGKKDGFFQLSFPSNSDSLNSPEGITIDEEGNVYIADWGNSRILIFKTNGTCIRIIGKWGINETYGESIRFIFPTRIAIAEDTSGFVYNGKRLYHGKYIFVADREGIHLLDSYGHYLDTIVHISPKFPEGSFYGIATEGYGVGAKLFVANKKNEEIVEFVAREMEIKKHK